MPTHDEIALRAHHLWKDHGAHHGNDQELWFEAERELTAAAANAADANHGHAAPVHANSEPVAHGEHRATEPTASQVQASRKKQNARTPQVPHHTGPAITPTAAGRPIFPKQHTS